jgi:hypothetical protein
MEAVDLLWIALAVMLFVLAGAAWQARAAVRQRRPWAWRAYVWLDDRARVAKLRARQRAGRAAPSVRLTVEKSAHRIGGEDG